MLTTSNSIKNCTVLVTGAAGFIGTHLVTALRENGAQVIATDRASAPGIQVLDVADSKQVSKTFQDPIDFVFHLAGQKSAALAKENPAETLTSSFAGVINLLEAARLQQRTKKVVLISSIAVCAAQNKPVRESDPTEADSIYSATKITTELLGHSYWSDFKLPVATARLANVYGPGQSKMAVIPSLIDQMQKSQELTFGNTDSIRDFIYVGDVVSALVGIALSDQASGRVLNVGTGRGVSIKEIIEILSRNLNFKGRLVVEQSKLRPNEKQSVIADIQEIKRVTGWAPQFQIEEGLKKCL